jgi:hypothetical protein
MPSVLSLLKVGNKISNTGSPPISSACRSGGFATKRTPGRLTCPPKIGPLEMRDSCRITAGGKDSESKKVFGGAGISDSKGG